MDTKQIEYIIKIAEENNITRAAEKLFITQSALNQQLLKLEKELGTPLFHRSRTNWRLTEAGEIYLKNAREMLRIKKSTYSQISDIAAIKRGTLSVGFTAGRGIGMFTTIYPAFHRRYPDIVVEPLEKTVHELQSMIADDSLDIAFLTLREQDKTSDTYLDLLSEEIVIAIPESHPLAEKAASPGEPLAVMDIRELKEDPFVLMSKTSTMRRLVNDIFDQAGFEPRLLFETRNNNTVITMIQAGLCCGLVPSYYIKHGHDGMACFALPDHPTWLVCAAYKHDAYLGHAAKYFIELAKEYWTT